MTDWIVRAAEEAKRRAEDQKRREEIRLINARQLVIQMQRFWESLERRIPEAAAQMHATSEIRRRTIRVTLRGHLVKLRFSPSRECVIVRRSGARDELRFSIDTYGNLSYSAQSGTLRHMIDLEEWLLRPMTEIPAKCPTCGLTTPTLSN